MSEAEMRMRELLADELDKGVLRYMVDEVRRGEGYGSPDSFAIRAMLAAEAAAIERCKRVADDELAAAQSARDQARRADNSTEALYRSGRIDAAQTIGLLLPTAIRSMKEGASHVG